VLFAAGGAAASARNVLLLRVCGRCACSASLSDVVTNGCLIHEWDVVDVFSRILSSQRLCVVWCACDLFLLLQRLWGWRAVSVSLSEVVTNGCVIHGWDVVYVFSHHRGFVGGVLGLRLSVR